MSARKKSIAALKQSKSALVITFSTEDSQDCTMGVINISPVHLAPILSAVADFIADKFNRSFTELVRNIITLEDSRDSE